MIDGTAYGIFTTLDKGNVDYFCACTAWLALLALLCLLGLRCFACLLCLACVHCFACVALLAQGLGLNSFIEFTQDGAPQEQPNHAIPSGSAFAQASKEMRTNSREKNEIL